MILLNRFKNGCPHAMTMSYDDGRPEDEKLIELFNRYGIKATFNLNSQNFVRMTAEQKEKIKAVYSGHEVSVHTVHHPRLERMLPAGVYSEVIEDRRALESVFGYVVRGMAYPYGTYSREVLNTLKSCGICYSRTTKSTYDFPIPDHFLEWHPTCHHVDCLEMADKFLSSMEYPWNSGLFYVWGHSFEFRGDSDWSRMEEFCRKMRNNPQVWYATNIEVYDYVMAQRGLLVSVDEKIITNPSCVDVWVTKDGETVRIGAGQTLRF